MKGRVRGRSRGRKEAERVGEREENIKAGSRNTTAVQNRERELLEGVHIT